MRRELFSANAESEEASFSLVRGSSDKTMDTSPLDDRPHASSGNTVPTSTDDTSEDETEYDAMGSLVVTSDPDNVAGSAAPRMPSPSGEPVPLETPQQSRQERDLSL